MLKIILIVVVAILIIFLGMSVVYIKTGFGKGFYHDVLQWHLPEGEVGYNGCSFTSKCKYCGEEIMQDSQGNWF